MYGVFSVLLTENPWLGDGVWDGCPAAVHGGQVDQEPRLLRLPPLQGPGRVYITFLAIARYAAGNGIFRDFKSIICYIKISPNMYIIYQEYWTLLCQVLLLEESWCELFLLCSVQWCLPLSSSSSLFSSSELPDLPSSLATSLDHLNLLLRRFRLGPWVL